MENNVVLAQSPSVPARDVSVITEEIRSLVKQANQMALMYAIEIGRRLLEAKSAVPYGQWGDYLKNEVNFSQSTANNFMRLFEEYGSAQISIFGAVTDSQSIANLPYTKALALLAVPTEAREDFAEEVGAENLSVSELKKAIADRDAAIKEAKEAKEREEEISERLKAAEDAAEISRAKSAEADSYRQKLDELVAKNERLANNAAKLKEKLKAAEENPSIPQETLDKIRSEAENAARQAYEELQGKELAEAKKKAEEAEKEREAALINERMAREHAEMLTKKLRAANPEVIAFKSLFDSLQELATKCRDKIAAISENDPETASKFSAAMAAFGNSLTI